MLPDYPHTKKLLDETYNEYLRRRHNQRLGLFGQIGASLLHEGEKCVLYRQDDSVQEVPMEHLRASIEVKVSEDSPSILSPAQIQEALDSLADRSAEMKIKMFLRCVDEAASEVGNVADPSKPPVDRFLELFEKWQIDFDHSGRPQWGQFIGGPHAIEELQNVLEELATNPVQKKRFEAMIERKRRHWNDREATRNLVG